MRFKTQIYQLTQRLHRQELHLARLQSKVKKRDLSEERLRNRLGNLYHHLPNRNFSSEEFQNLLKSVEEKLRNSEDQTLLKVEEENSLPGEKSPIVGSEWLPNAGMMSQFDHLLFGSIAMEHGLHRWDYAQVLDALLLEIKSRYKSVSVSKNDNASCAKFA